MARASSIGLNSASVRRPTGIRSKSPRPPEGRVSIGATAQLCASLSQDYGPLFFFRDGRGRSRALAHDQQHGILVLGAIPVHLLAGMGDEAAGRHRHRTMLGVELRTRADPPCAL